jgi:hypothetical protein
MGSGVDLGIIRGVLDAMPQQRYQDPSIQRNKNGSYYIRPLVDVIGKDGKLTRKKKTIVLGPAELGERKAKAAKSKVMETINQCDYVIKAPDSFPGPGERVPEETSLQARIRAAV